ncbi:ankyrin repeat domain-containing protein [Sphingomonas sp.]|uniref:ankyrin repeat domain-containing protein n=1 Tax=Sphingomonas sp. TaxID=28214 RepID=UPI003B3A949F
MAKKRKTLPKDFEDMLKTADLADLQAVFATCDVDARGGYSKRTALAFNDCPDDLARWLVEQGADVNAEDIYGETPLHARAGHWQGRLDILVELGADVNHGEGGRGAPLHRAAMSALSRNVQRLLAHGAKVDALDRQGFTPLEIALRGCSNAQIEGVADLAAIMLEAGARITDRMPAFVTRIGEQFEFHRAGFNKDSLAATDAALHRLYALFDVPPVPRRLMHDGKAPIIVTAGRWQDAHQQLWELLVPSQGAAQTVQGEVIRIAGRIARELDGNGGVNWDRQFRSMVEAWRRHVASGTPLPPADLAKADAIVAGIDRNGGDCEGMMELAVAWVARNPDPIPLPPPAYQR